MNKSYDEIYAERQKRIRDAIDLKIPDRVPFSPLFNFFPARYSGISTEDYMHDYEKAAKALKKVHVDIQPDTYADSLRSFAIGPTLGAMGYKQLKWPGHGVDPNVTYQFVESELMREEEYDAFIDDPSDFILRTFYPRVFQELAGLKNLPYLPMSYAYTRVLPLAATFADPEFERTASGPGSSGRHQYRGNRRT